MLRKLLLVLCCFLCSISFYGQKNYEIRKVSVGSLACCVIEPKSSWELKKSVIEGKDSYEGMPIPSREYWQNIVPKIRDTYLSKTELLKLRDAKEVITVNVMFDYLGNMKHVEIVFDEKVFSIIMEEQLISIYKEFWKLKVPVNGSLKSSQYYRGTLSLLNIDKKRKRIDRETLPCVYEI